MSPVRRLTMAIAGIVALSSVLVTTAAGQAGAAPPPLPQSDSSAWLRQINVYRQAAGLSPVTEEPSWSAGLRNHFIYLQLTDPDLFVPPYDNLHTENPASPYYSDLGAQEASRSNLFFGVDGWPPAEVIDGWFSGPFHAIGMLRPGLQRVAFSSSDGLAGLDVIGGLTDAPPAQVLFPGNGMTTNLTLYDGYELPDPLETCGWQDRPAGLPLIALLTTAPAAGLTATLTSANGQQFRTGDGSLCVVDENTYRSSDEVYGPTGQAILEGDHAVVLIPNRWLDWGRFTATINQPARAAITWSFIAAPKGNVAPGASYTLHVADPGVKTVLGNLTVTGAGASGFVTAYPCLNGRPNSSNLNYAAGQTLANFVAVQPDANGDVCFYSYAETGLIWDQVAETDAVTTHNATRLLDTRTSRDRLPANGVRKVHVATPGTKTVMGNLTAVGPAGSGFVTAYACTPTPPNSSNLNYAAGQTLANFVTVQPDANGDICFHSYAATDLIWDQVAETGAVTTHNATRLLDTRNSRDRLPAGGTRKLHVASPGTQTVMGNVTAVVPGAGGFITAYPCLNGRPNSSNLNYAAGQTLANFVTVQPDANGDVCFYSYSATDLIWDQVAETGAVVTHNAARLVDTRNSGPILPR
ncbi:CAP domain-containing protein [Nakamurella sp.]|uniref:CAP domain-containing protein n=1 Tax=Nakamurella sp. TaxID=1869182 RepID=UPI003B3A995F